MGGIEMASIVRWHPMREMIGMQDAMDRMLQEGFFRMPMPYRAAMVMKKVSINRPQ
jgi:hypothetical protein